MTNNTPIVKSLLETDLYKFSMWQALMHSHPNAQAMYEYVCRNTPEYPLAELEDDVNRELDHLCSLMFKEDELNYLRSLRYIKSDFVDYLELFHFQRKFITAKAVDGKLAIKAEGPLVHVMGFEIFVLYIVSELYFRRFPQFNDGTFMEISRTNLAQKIAKLKAAKPSAKHAFEFFDFGLRRRFSGEWQDEMVRTLAKEIPEYFKGTSNVYLAMKYNLVPIGTMAHEYLQAYQGFGVRLRDFQKCALEGWVQEYRGDLGTALTDVVGMDAFLEDFDLYFAKLFDGLRHDSGDPVVWGEKALAHYAKLKIDANTKRLVFSDGLNIDSAIELHKHFGDRIMTGFGIGTNLSNDVGVKPLNLVMKIMESNGQPVAKLSDSPGKTLCKDETFISYLKQVFKHNL